MAAKKAEHPVKVALRDGAPIMHTAKWLGEKNIIDTKDWSPVWLSLLTARFYFNTRRNDIQEYFKQEKLDRPFTYVDTGYNGSITNYFDKNQPQKLQTLFMAGSKQFFNKDRGKKRFAFLNEIKIHKQTKSAFEQIPDEMTTTRVYEDFCENILENIPKNTESHLDSYKKNAYKLFKRDVDGRLQADLILASQLEIDSYDNYIKGLTKGFDDCSHTKLDVSNKQFKRYLQEFLQTTAPMSRLFDTTKIDMEWYGSKMPIFDKRICSDVLRKRDKIEDIYKGK